MTINRRKSLRHRLAGYALSLPVLCLLFVPTANAATSLPGPASPNRIEQRFKPAPTPKAKPEITIPSLKTPLLPAEALKTTFTLKSVILDNSTVYKPADLTPLYRGLIGKKITLAQVFTLRDTLTARYRRDGYILSQVIVPPQKIIGGVVHMQAVEGYVADVHIKGDANDSRGLVAAMAERIKATRPLTVKALERYVLLMQDIPGLSVRTVLRPAKNIPGATILDLMVTHKVVTAYVSANNRGSRAIGPYQGQVGINLNSPFGRDDLTSLQLATVNRPRELQYVALRHDEILTPEGARLKLAATYSRSKPRGALVSLDPLGNSLTLRAGLDYPVIRSRSRTLRVGVSFTSLNSSVDLLSARYSDDRVRYLSLTANFDVADTLLGDNHPASTIINAGLSRGLNILGATKTGSSNLSVANGHSDFTRFTVDLTRNQSLWGPFELGLSAEGQVSSAPLLSAIRFGLGGSRFGRGYEPSEILGDDGVAGSVEVRYNLPFGNALIVNPQLYVFYDVGKVWKISPATGQPRSESLASAGPGFRFDLARHISADIEVAKPLTRDIASRGNRNIQVLFSVTAQL